MTIIIVYARYTGAMTDNERRYPAGMDKHVEKQDLRKPEYFVNRELSHLEFNRRVLAQAQDPDVPLLERLSYLCIAASNLDEFFEVRVASLREKAAYGSVQTGADGMAASDVLARISDFAHQVVDQQYELLNDELIPRLAEAGIRFPRRDAWSDELAAWIKKYFNSQVMPILTPMGLDPAHPFPRVLNKSLHFIVSLEGKDAFGRSSGLAVVQAPRSLPRLIQVPAEFAEGPHDFVFLSSIIHAHVGDLFPGMNALGCYQFRVTRNSELFIDDEETSDLLHALEGELPSRRFGEAVRIEVADNCPAAASEYLLDEFGLSGQELYQVNGPVNLNRLQQVYELIDRPDLKFPPFVSALPARLSGKNSLFEVIQSGDVLLHHPFESFVPVVDLLRQAAADPSVLAIKQTLYRTGPDSAVVNALVDAARAGKEVTVVIELRARFDEEANIALANRLHEAGAHIAYGVVGYKTHAKMVLIVRREGRRLRRYVHLGTGNYHARTARLYTDYGLLSCDQALGIDVNKVFQQLTGLGQATRLKKILQSPFTLHKTLLQYIEREIENAGKGKAARIIVKINALTETSMIEALYRASQAGVRIELIVRGICCLRPGVPGVSDKIHVRSIIGRFLEHTRIYYFQNDDEPEIFCSSADWMDRNLHRRVEVAFPIEDSKLASRVLKAGLLSYLSDNTQAWIMQNDGSYVRCGPGNAKPKSAQQSLLELLCR